MKLDESKLSFLATSRRFLVRAINESVCYFYYIGTMRDKNFTYLSPRGKNMTGSLVYYRTLNPQRDGDYLPFSFSGHFAAHCPRHNQPLGRFLIERFADEQRNCQYEKLFIFLNDSETWKELVMNKRSIFRPFQKFVFPVK